MRQKSGLRSESLKNLIEVLSAATRTKACNVSRTLYGRIATLTMFMLFLWCVHAFGSESALMLGYGFGEWNGSSTGRIENGFHYDYMGLSYIYEKQFTRKIILGLEPFANIDFRPKTGLDLGCSVNAKYYLSNEAKDGFYLTAGIGGAYTSIRFQEQGTHMLFILHGGFGYRTGSVFIENRFFHYSNGGLARPNRSVNSNTVRVGYYF